MVKRWPSAVLASTMLHVVAAALVVWVGYLLVEPASPRLVLQLVGPGPRSFSPAGPRANEDVGVRFVAPKLRPLPPEPAAIERTVAAALPVVEPRSPRSALTAPAPGARPARISKPEFDRRHGAVMRPESSRPATAPRVDTNFGPALTEPAASGQPVLPAGAGAHTAYMDELGQALVDRLEQVPGLDDGLRAEIEFHILADGRLVDARLTRRSGDERFDAAILRALASLGMPPRPADVAEIQSLPVVTRAKDQPAGGR